MTAILWLAFSDWMNSNTLTGSSGSPWRRRPRLFSRCRVPRAAPGSRVAAVPTRHDPRSSSHRRGGPRRDLLDGPSSATTAATRQDHRRPRTTCDHHFARGGSPQPGTPADTAREHVDAAQGLLPRKRCIPALRCPPIRVNSTFPVLVGYFVQADRIDVTAALAVVAAF